MLTKWRFLVGGAPHGTGNIGDEAIATVVVDRLKGLVPGDRIALMTLAPEMAVQSYGVHPIPFVQPKYLRCFVASELFVFAGATMLSQAPELSARLLERCAQLRKPFIMYACGINPMSDEVMCRRLARACQRAEFITVRERESGLRLREMGVTEPPIAVTGDTVLGLHPAPEEAVEPILARNQIQLDGHVAVVGMCFEPGYEAHMPDVGEMARAVDHLADAGYTVLFLPMETRAGCDCVAHIRVHNAMRRKDRAYLIHEMLTSSEVLALVARADLVVSSRLHLLILGASAGVPCLGISRQEKIAEFCRSVGLEPVSTPEEFTADRFVERYCELERSSAEVRRSLVDRVAGLKDDEQWNARLLERFHARTLGATSLGVPERMLVGGS